jgi:hypothetical protein
MRSTMRCASKRNYHDEAVAHGNIEVRSEARYSHGIAVTRCATPGHLGRIDGIEKVLRAGYSDGDIEAVGDWIVVAMCFSNATVIKPG